MRKENKEVIWVYINCALSPRLTEPHWSPVSPNNPQLCLHLLPLTPSDTHRPPLSPNYPPINPKDPHPLSPIDPTLHGSNEPQLSLVIPNWPPLIPTEPHWPQMSFTEPNVASSEPHWVIWTHDT